MVAALMVISFSQVFWEAGMGKALIQQGDIHKAADVAFWINIVLGLQWPQPCFFLQLPSLKCFFTTTGLPKFCRS